MKNERVPGEFVTSIAVEDVVISLGVQLALWANDIAFTDAPFGATWCIETADRMVCLSQLLHAIYEHAPRKFMASVITMPEGMVGQVQVNPNYEPGATKPPSGDDGDVDNKKGGASSIDDLFPF